MSRRPLSTLAFAALAVARAAAFDVEVKDIRASSSMVRTTVQVHNVVPDRFKNLVERGERLHLRLQAELWEERPVWDRLVYPAIVRLLRFGRRQPGAEITIDDSTLGTTTVATIPNPLELIVDLGNRDRVAAARNYYVHVIATIGTLADRDVDDVGDAVFGKETDASGLESFGRMLFRTALKIGDYLQSVSSETKSRRLAGAEILRP